MIRKGKTKSFVNYSKGPNPIIFVIAILIVALVYYSPQLVDGKRITGLKTKVDSFIKQSMINAFSPKQNQESVDFPEYFVSPSVASPTPVISPTGSFYQKTQIYPTPTSQTENRQGVYPASSFEWPTYSPPTVAPGAPGSKEWEDEFQRKWDEMTKQNQEMQKQVEDSQKKFCDENPDLCKNFK